MMLWGMTHKAMSPRRRPEGGRGGYALVKAMFCCLAAGLMLVGLLTGCSTRPVPIRPMAAVEAALAQPEVAAWYAAHSAPQVLQGLNPAAAKGLQGLKPVTMVDLASEGLLVRFDASLGSAPRRVEVLVDKELGAVVEVKMR